MKRQDLDHRWQFLIFGIKMGKDLYKKPAVGRKVGTDRFRRTGRQDVLKKAQDLLFHIKRKSSTVKGKGWKPEKTLPGNDLLGADNTQKLLYLFAVVIYFFSDFFYFI